MLWGLVKDLIEQDIRLLSDGADRAVEGIGQVELSIQPDPIHLVISIPPKVSVVVNKIGCSAKSHNRQNVEFINYL